MQTKQDIQTLAKELAGLYKKVLNSKHHEGILETAGELIYDQSDDIRQHDGVALARVAQIAIEVANRASADTYELALFWEQESRFNRSDFSEKDCQENSEAFIKASDAYKNYLRTILKAGLKLNRDLAKSGI